MSERSRHPFRVIGRVVRILLEFLLATLRFPWFVALRGGPPALPARALWLHRSSRRVLRILGMDPHFSGLVPNSGLLVCNHLSYLDVLVLAAITPSVFVAKREIQHWPLFGWFARLAGTVFVHRERRTQTREAMERIEAVLAAGALVVLFPEGTSSDGRTVLPFKSSLLEPATRQNQPLTAGWIRYELDDGDVGEEVCYWRDMTLLPHLVNLLGKRRVRAYVRFTPLRDASADRKALAAQLHTEILKLKAAATSS
jgi:1-acyl-sn-glycerol-3-phosphate acyltransferase